MQAPARIEAAFAKQLDRCGYLLAKKKAADAEPWRDELKGLLEIVQERFANSPADVPIRAEGSIYYIDLTKRENRRVITHKRRAFDALKRIMGIAALIEALTITFKLLDEHLTPEQTAPFVTQGRTGPREVTGVLKVPTAA